MVIFKQDLSGMVSTHSRLKAAVLIHVVRVFVRFVSTHSRLKAAEPLSKALLHQVSQP